MMTEIRQKMSYDDLYLIRNANSQSLEKMPEVCGERIIFEMNNFRKAKLEKGAA